MPMVRVSNGGTNNFVFMVKEKNSINIYYGDQDTAFSALTLNGYTATVPTNNIISGSCNYYESNFTALVDIRVYALRTIDSYVGSIDISAGNALPNFSGNNSNTWVFLAFPI